MSLQINIGHSGRILQIDTSRISSLDALRSWVAQGASIPTNKQVFLTNKGKSVRPQTLLTETELFVFDSTLLTPSVGGAPKRSLDLADEPTTTNTSSPPDTITNQTDLQSWQTLFQDRLRWAMDLRAQSASLAAYAQRSVEEQAVIQRGLGVAVMSLQIHTKSAEQKHAAAESWSNDLLREQEKRNDTWEGDLRTLGELRARPEFARFIQVQREPSRPAQGTTLQSFVDVAQVKRAAESSQSIMAGFTKRVDGIRSLLKDSGAQSEDLLNATEQMQAMSSNEASTEPDKLMEEIDIIIRKMSSDLDHVKSLARNAQSVSQASKMALLHTRNYIPNLQEYSAEMNELIQRTVQQRNSTAEAALQHMQTLAKIENQLSHAYSEIKALDVPQEDQNAFHILNTVSRLPYVYGSLLVEAVRRREWVEKMKRDSSTLAEEMATYQEEEERRRKKWLNSIDDVVRPEIFKSKALGIEINLQVEEDNWPVVSRQDLIDYIDRLHEIKAEKDMIEGIMQEMKSLDQPTKKQIKHAKTFKNGSMHEAAFGSTSLMLRGEDEYKVLRDANSRLEEELRGHKSRVRKLEDLLHRQTAMSRVSTGDVFTPQIELVSGPELPRIQSPKPSQDFIRQDALLSRRVSVQQPTEEKKLARRIVTLEAELQTLKDRNTTLEKDAQAKRKVEEDGRLQIEEAISTKKDIMENMEAQQREFANERRTLEQELGHARSKIEEIEDEIDRLLGSRDGIDARSRALVTELEDARSDAAAAAKASQEQFERIEQALQEQQDQNHELVDQIKAAQSAKEESEKRMQAMGEQNQQSEMDHRSALAAAHGHLSPATELPSKYTNLVLGLEDLARRSASHVRDLAQAIAMAKSENESLLSQRELQDAELSEAKSKQAELETDLARLRDTSAAEKASAASLSTQLDDEREQLRLLRTKFADGETGADTIRQRAAEEEARAGQLARELAGSKSHINSLDVELMHVQNKLNAAQTAVTTTTERLTQRSARSREVSQRLYTNNARLLRLLETLGFAVSHKDSAMTIERASKVGASTMLMDPSAAMNRTVSLSSPPLTRKSSQSDDPHTLNFLHWADAPTPEDEASVYEAFIKHIALFSTDTFSEAIAKRLRDFEYTARKWQKEAKSYKEKSHRFQAEGHAKIAVRDFKEGDLALFLPTKGKHMGAWAAFNINAPHHFLHEREGMSLSRREWLVARISRVEERVVDLSKSMSVAPSDGRSIGSASNMSLEDNDNPFELSDGLTWYLVHAAEEKGGAPTTPGLGKSTVASANVDARGSIRVKKGLKSDDASKTLNKSLDSRRSSSNSKVSVKGAIVPTIAGPSTEQSTLPLGRGRSESQSHINDARSAPSGLGILSSASTTPQKEKDDAPPITHHDQVRNDLLWGP